MTQQQLQHKHHEDPYISQPEFDNRVSYLLTIRQGEYNITVVVFTNMWDLREAHKDEKALLPNYRR